MNMVLAAVDQFSDYNTYTNLIFLGATCSNTILHLNDYDTFCRTETSRSPLLMTL